MNAVAADAAAAVIPCRGEPPSLELLERVAARVGTVVVALDGIEPAAERVLEARAAAAGASILPLGPGRGKGYVLREAIEHLSTNHTIEAVLTIDADGQHPPEAIPGFLAASADAELVVGDRFGGGGPIPFHRRLANRVASRALAALTGADVRDSQCGMRLLRGRALAIGLPAGGFESETAHLKRCLRAGVRVAWVPIPAIYDGAPSRFRPLRDSARVAWAVLRS